MSQTISTPNKERDDRSRHIAPAILLLRQALGDRATVDWFPEAAQQSGAIVTVNWRGAIGGPQRLRLLPLSDAVAPPGQLRKTPDIPVVWVLSRASARMRKTLRSRGEPFVDLRGAVYLTLPWVLVDRADLKPIRIQSSRGGALNPFADRASLVLRVMLEKRDHHYVWHVREIAAAAGVGVATASDIVRALALRRVVSVTRLGRTSEIRLTDPHDAIDSWTRVYDWRLNHALAVQLPTADAQRFVRQLPNHMKDTLSPTLRWALTLQAGASLVASHATWERVHVYVDAPKQDGVRSLAMVAARAGWSPSPDGRLVLLLPHYRASVWHAMRTLDRLPVVSDIQLVLDLWHYPVRGREQAEFLLSRRLRDGRGVTSAR